MLNMLAQEYYDTISEKKVIYKRNFQDFNYIILITYKPYYVLVTFVFTFRN